jgi:UDP-glucose 4-epimerase
MKIFLTGGTGFIGSHVLKLLSDNGHEVIVLARNPEKVPGLTGLPGVRIIHGTLYDFEIIKKNLQNCDACIHIALGWGDSAVDMLKNDTIPTVYLMEESAKSGLKAFIYTSSSAAVGYSQIEDINEESKTKPVDYYGAAKAASENFLHAVSYNYSMRCNIIRPGYTFGNPVVNGGFMQPDARFRDIVIKAKQNIDINLIKYDGTQFIDADDLAKIYLSVLNSNVNRQIYFGLSTEYVTWEEIARETIKLIDSKSVIKLIDKGYDENPHLYIVDKIKRDFGLDFKCRDNIRKHLEFLIRNV